MYNTYNEEVQANFDGTKDFIAEQIMKLIVDTSEAEMIFDEINTIVID